MAKKAASTDNPMDWYRADLHVHTPCSRCYGKQGFQRGSAEEDAALHDLLSELRRAKIDIVAITDHNEIRAYWRILQLQLDICSALESLNRAKVKIPETLMEQAQLFDDLVILPGCELDVNPNIHLTVVFNPETQESDMDQFLSEAGFPIDRRGFESDAMSAKWNVPQALSAIDAIGAIGIAAHADSSKGLYNASKDWNGARVAAFTHDGLYAMEFGNTVTRDKILSILEQPQYRRDTQLAFIQSSDYHARDGESIGGRMTWFRLDSKPQLDREFFRDLREALRNPNERVSAPGAPHFQQILTQLESQPHIGNTTNESERRQLVHLACAYSNVGDGTIVVGRKKNGSWVGVEYLDDEQMRGDIRELLRCEIEPEPLSEITIYPEFGSRALITVRVRRAPATHVAVHEDVAYGLVNGEPTPYSTRATIEHAEAALVARYARLSISPRLQQISRRLEALTDSLDILSLFRRIESGTSPVPQCFAAYEGSTLSPEARQALDYPGNGYADGDVVVADGAKPRFTTQYVRFLSPLAKWQDSESTHNLPTFEGPALAIAPEGAIYLIEDGAFAIVSSNGVPHVLVPRSDCPDLKVALAFFRSSLGLWFAYRCLGTTDYNDTGSVLPRMRIPRSDIGESESGEISALTNSILDLERNFLTTCEQSYPSENEEPLDEFVARTGAVIDSHNRRAAQLCASIDQSFYALFRVSESERKAIEAGLRAAGMVIFPTT